MHAFHRYRAHSRCRPRQGRPDYCILLDFFGRDPNNLVSLAMVVARREVYRLDLLNIISCFIPTVSACHWERWAELNKKWLATATIDKSGCFDGCIVHLGWNLGVYGAVRIVETSKWRWIEYPLSLASASPTGPLLSRPSLLLVGVGVVFYYCSRGC